MRISEPALKKLIKNKGMTIKSFGAKLGMTRQGAYHLMIRKSVKQDLIDKICTVLSVDKKEFLIPENVTPEISEKLNLEKEISRLHTMIEDKNKIIDAQTKALIMAERYINSLTKKVATIIKPKPQ